MTHDCENDEDFIAQLSAAGEKPVIVDFCATWCGPCTWIAPHFEELAVKFQGKMLFLKVDVEKCQEISDKYKINSLPTFLICNKGKPVDGEMCQASIANLEALVQRTAEK